MIGICSTGIFGLPSGAARASADRRFYAAFGAVQRHRDWSNHLSYGPLRRLFAKFATKPPSIDFPKTLFSYDIPGSSVRAKPSVV